MPSADIKEHSPTGSIESNFSAVQLNQFLIRIRQFEPNSFKCFFLLWCDCVVTVFTVEDIALMNVQRAFIEMKRPVEDEDMLYETAIKSSKRSPQSARGQLERMTAPSSLSGTEIPQGWSSCLSRDPLLSDLGSNARSACCTYAVLRRIHHNAQSKKAFSICSKEYTTLSS